MRRVVLHLEYQGTHYSGWQKQKMTSRTIQAALENAVSLIADEPIEVICAGRTDAGVHASGQVVHFDTQAIRTERAWVLGTNTHLPEDIRVMGAQFVSEAFHARYEALSRSYGYLIANQGIRPAFMRSYVTWILKPLDIDAMQQAAQHWIGEHDFSSFRAKDCQAKHPNRRIDFIHIQKKGNLIQIGIRGNAFLHHMVRNMVGTLLPIGWGEKPSHWAKEVLLARLRAAAGETAPAQGLTLRHVDYAPLHALHWQAKSGLVDSFLEWV